jgi:hypothetical protein
MEFAPGQKVAGQACQINLGKRRRILDAGLAPLSNQRLPVEPSKVSFVPNPVPDFPSYWASQGRPAQQLGNLGPFEKASSGRLQAQDLDQLG